jgi:hypothetical protein
VRRFMIRRCVRSFWDACSLGASIFARIADDVPLDAVKIPNRGFTAYVRIRAEGRTLSGAAGLSSFLSASITLPPP